MSSIMGKLNGIKLEILTYKYRICFRSSTTTTLFNFRDDDYQYLQKSKLPMLHFQRSLPRLPIPKLEKTCERYLKALRPILSEADYYNSERLVENFKKSAGAQLQKMLVDSDNQNRHTSYISQPWFEMYLKSRDPVCINYNPIMMFKNDPRPNYNNQLVRSANFVVTALRFMRALKAGYLKPEIYHLNPQKSDTNFFQTSMKFAPKLIATYVAYAFMAFPLDMSQYSGLFGGTRIPEMGLDRIYHEPDAAHIIVMRNGNFYVVDVLDNEGYIESPNVILGRIKRVLNDNTSSAKYPLGILTTANRDDWAVLRKHLIDIGNSEQLNKIDSAIFCMCLDSTTFSQDDPKPLTRHFLAGNGINRWFDKSLSILMSADGLTGVNFEHSWGDGVAVLRFFNEVYNETTQNPIIHPHTVPQNEVEGNAVKLLEFNLDERMKLAIVDAQQKHNNVMESLDFDYLKYDDIHRRFCKKYNLSADALMQLAFQLAYKQQYGKYVGCYESCSTAAFRHGRTETMRPCTTATTTFCDSVLLKHNAPSRPELRAMLNACSELHKKLVVEAAKGQGFDRHLFGLKYIAETNRMAVPSLYTDAAYSCINHNIISTSTLDSEALLIGSFGPVVKDGLGIAYQIRKDYCGAVVTSYRGQQNAAQFIDSLKNSLDIIKATLENN